MAAAAPPPIPPPLGEDEDDMGDFPDSDDDYAKRMADNTFSLDQFRKIDDLILTWDPNNTACLSRKDDPNYLLAVNSSALCLLTNIIFVSYLKIRKTYEFRFPHLKHLVTHPADYAWVVNKFGKAVDLASVHLQEVLPPLLAVYISDVAAYTTTRKFHNLPKNQLNKTLARCDRLLDYYRAKKILTKFVESKRGPLHPGTIAGITKLDMGPCFYDTFLSSPDVRYYINSNQRSATPP